MLKDYFKDDDNTYDSTVQTFRNPSSWIPPNSKVSSSTHETILRLSEATESLINNHSIVDNDFIRLRHQTPNLTSSERAAIRTLQDNKDIVIKPADKGSAVVILDQHNYLHEGYRQLNNTSYYQRLSTPIYKETGRQINDILSQMVKDHSIDQQQYDYLCSKETDRQRRFYMLPKIHKPIEKWTIPNSLPECRPIISNSGSESIRVAQYIDHHLRPISIKNPTYIKDTYDFVNKVRGSHIPANAFLVTADVSSLYTNMNIDRIISTVENALKKHPVPGRPDEHLLRLLNITLRRNDFTFNNDCFLQVCGAAMGIPYAPTLANIYLEYFDQQACNGFNTHPTLYFRYIDDIFFIWTSTIDELKRFESFLNNIIPGIKIELNYSTSAVQFLDTTVYVSEQHNLETKVFFKATDTHQLLHKNSFHPRHTCNGVLKSQFIRFKRICNRKIDYDEASRILIRALRQRNYNPSLMRKIKRDVWADVSLLHPKATNKQQLLPIVVPFNEFGEKLAQSWRNIIKSNPNFTNHRIITAYTVGPSLRSKLVNSLVLNPDGNPKLQLNPKSSTTDNRKNGSYTCNGNHCRCCRYVINNNVVTSNTNGNSFDIRGVITCKSTNIIYIIICRQCNRQYVGETSRKLAQRLTDHLSRIRTHKRTAVAIHFNSPNHSIHDLTIMGIESTRQTQTADIRKIREKTWITLLQTAHPNGLNFYPTNT